MLHPLRRALCAAVTLCASVFVAPTTSFADSQPYLGDVMPVAFNFCPRGWTIAEGGLLAIDTHQALFSLLGTIYGGDGRTTFGVPDMRGRHAVGNGQSPGLSFYHLGQQSGREEVVINQSNLPSHNHGFNLVAQGTNVSNSPVGASVFERNAGAADAFRDTGTNLVPMASTSVTGTANNQLIDIRSPAIAIVWCIAIEGIFPSRP